MLATGGVILTTAGSLLISRSLELVKPIEFTHMKIGTGDISSIAQARKLNDLVASYKNINMSTLVRSGDLVRVRGSFTNDEITETVRIKEVGVFAKIGTEQPILFGYVNDGEGELIPPGTSGVIARTRDLYIGVTGEAEVVITINKSLVYGTIEDLEEGLNRKEDKYIKRSGWNLDKTDLTENDSNKLFTPKGALNLFNTLTTNFTNGINAAKEVLRLDIVKKLNKGAYLGDAQDLKNDIDTKVSKSGDIMKGSLWIGNRSKVNFMDDYGSPVFMTDKAGEYHFGIGAKYKRTDTNLEDQAIRYGNCNMSTGEWLEINSYYKHYFDGEIYAQGQYKVYHPNNKPTPTEIGAEPSFPKKTGFNLDKTDLTENESNKLFSAKGALNLFNTLTTNFTNAINTAKETLRLEIIKKVAKTGDTMSGDLIMTSSGKYRAFNGDMIVYKDTRKGIYANDNYIGFTDELSQWLFRCHNTGEIYCKDNKRVYTESYKPTPSAIGAVNKEGDSLTGNLIFGKNRIRYAPNYGNPEFVMDKPGNDNFGIGGKSTTDVQTIRYGRVVTSTFDWGVIDNSYKHYFDGEIYAQGGTARVFHKSITPTRILSTNTKSLIVSGWKRFFLSESLVNYTFIIFVLSDSLDPSSSGAFDNHTVCVPTSYFRQRNVYLEDNTNSWDNGVGFDWVSDTEVSLYLNATSTNPDNNGVEIFGI